MNPTLKIGTRTSLLAMAQSRLVARLLRKHNPGLTIELVGIQTRGDQTLDVPLSQMEGKDFFVAELDQALINRTVDCTVHSMKDLSLERPAAISLAAIPTRENPRDIVLYSADIMSRLRSGAEIRIGTSSPRRMSSAPTFLANALPQFGVTPQLAPREIRGNVHTRIGFLSRPASDPQRVDAVVLAFAGLIRLWNDPDGRQALSKLLSGLRWMVLPLAECPAAPAQGALAIECRTDDTATRELLVKLHNPASAAAVALERNVLADWGGGCHQNLGATAVQLDALGTLMYIRGHRANSDDLANNRNNSGNVMELRWQAAGTPPTEPHWDGTVWRESAYRTRHYTDLPLPRWLDSSGATFIAHSRALPEAWQGGLAAGSQRIWTSGVRSWLRLAARGIWVEGCAEELGFDGLLPILEQGVLQLPPLANWQVLTHADGTAGWPCNQIIATYVAEPTAELTDEHPAVIALQQASSVFWTSGSQYAAFRRWVPANAQHACRYGKTYNYLREQLHAAGSSAVSVYPSVAQWRARLKLGL